MSRRRLSRAPLPGTGPAVRRTAATGLLGVVAILCVGGPAGADTGGTRSDLASGLVDGSFARAGGGSAAQRPERLAASAAVASSPGAPPATLSRGMREFERSSAVRMAHRRARTRTRADDLLASLAPVAPVRRALPGIDPSHEADTLRILRAAGRAVLACDAAHHRDARSGVLCSHSTTRPPPVRG